ncbi:hypothetical protein DVH24_000424 [Malus domestica]|uniref:Uncharacterized protein n=1 Tax=Malus domestica TaxID=3750 RepID=A0A498J289_MALDO|nr:hypothetical protein DVH24_000424 [Malus domestica]
MNIKPKHATALHNGHCHCSSSSLTSSRQSRPRVQKLLGRMEDFPIILGNSRFVAIWPLLGPFFS